MPEFKLEKELYDFNVGQHSTSRTIEVRCIATGHVVARFDFEEDEEMARVQAKQFANGLATVYFAGASIDLQGLLASDEFLDREYCWRIEYPTKTES